jgi:hypothetical protein
MARRKLVGTMRVGKARIVGVDRWNIFIIKDTTYQLGIISSLSRL